MGQVATTIASAERHKQIVLKIVDSRDVGLQLQPRCEAIDKLMLTEPDGPKRGL